MPNPYEKLVGRELKPVETRQIRDNLVSFVGLLVQIDRQQKSNVLNDDKNN